MPCERHSEDQFKTYLRWMRENVEAALKAHSTLLGGNGDWLLNSALGLLVGAYSDALGKVLDPQAKNNRERFHAFASKHLMAVLKPDPPVEGTMQVFRPTPPFHLDTHPGAFAFWSIFRNGFAHAFAPTTKHVMEFRWGRYDDPRGWIQREDVCCAGDATCRMEQVDVIDLNLDAVARAFLDAATAQQADWDREVTNSRATWKGLLEDLQRE